MDNDTWFFAHDDMRSEALTFDEIRRLFRTGEIQSNDLIWTTGFANWVPARDVAELRDAAAHEEEAAVPDAGSLHGSALDPASIEAFAVTGRYRKRITAAATLYLVMLFVLEAFGLLVLAVGLRSTATPGDPSADVAAPVMIGILLVGITALHLWAARSTRRSRRAAPMTMFILAIAIEFFCGIALLLLSDNWETAQRVGQLIFMAALAIVAVISWRAYAAIPKYLAQPAWCRELIACGKL